MDEVPLGHYSTTWDITGAPISIGFELFLLHAKIDSTARLILCQQEQPLVSIATAFFWASKEPSGKKTIHQRFRKWQRQDRRQDQDKKALEYLPKFLCEIELLQENVNEQNEKAQEQLQQQRRDLQEKFEEQLQQQRRIL
jgi:hypothetical protein